MELANGAPRAARGRLLNPRARSAVSSSAGPDRKDCASKPHATYQAARQHSVPLISDARYDAADHDGDGVF
jgi:hypothetical protein